MRFVVDASVALKWFVQEPGSETAAKLLDHELYAPELLIPECANILWKKVTRRELSPAVSGVVAEALEAVGVELVSMRDRLAEIHRLALRLRHSAYDCAYLAVALELDTPMVTADESFAATCAKHGRGEYARFVQRLEIRTG